MPEAIVSQSMIEDLDTYARTSDTGTTRKLQVVKAGSTLFGVHCEEVAAIVPWQEPVPLPHAPKAVMGVVSIQGRMLTVLDLKLLNGSDEQIDGHSHIVALRGDEQLAIAVDSLGAVIEVAARDLQPEKDSSGLVRQVLPLEDGKLKVVNVKELFPSALQGRERRRRRF
jgi:chemotaxis signal transduction protein